MHRSMGEHHYSTAIIAAFGGFAGGFCAYLITGYALTEAQWCIVGEEHCLREWVSALSGWAAAITAGATILYFRWESRRKELLQWREIVNSAELLRGKLEPQLNHLLGAVKFTHNVNTPQWVVPCLERIQAAIVDADNQEFRKASAGVSALRDTAMRLIDESIAFYRSFLEARCLPGDVEIRHLALTHEFLERFLSELEQVVASARNPRGYRGL